MKRPLFKLLTGLFFLSACESADMHTPKKEIKEKDARFPLVKMGQTERKGNYEIVLYLQNPVYEPSEVLFFELQSDKEMSEFELTWQASMTADEVKKLFKKDFQNTLDGVELESLSRQIADFLALLPDLKSGEKLTLRRVPAGKVEVRKGDRKLGEIHNIPFAKALWNIWLGPHSVVNRILLISNYVNIVTSELLSVH